MIQLNNTLLNTSSLFGPQDPTNTAAPQTSSQSTDGFQSALSAALSATLQEFGINPNQVTVSIAPAASSTPMTPATDPFSAAAAAANVGGTAPTPAIATPAAPTTTPATDTPASADSNGGTQSFDDAYWAQQPPAIQALRSMDNFNARAQAASELSAKGYQIDVPIMVWGWDPVGVMTLRQQLGYTWVPSALQPPTEIIPGLMAAGTNSSAPVSPGPMYIKVSIDAADYPVYP